MTHADAVAFLAPAGPFHGTWADVGAGAGTFARALAELLGEGGAVIAIDTDERALAALRRGTDGRGDGAEITTLRGDMHALDGIEGLEGVAFDGVLLANVLHFTRTPGDVLARAAGRLKAEGRIVVIEYERGMPNPWVPYPLPLAKLAEVAVRAGLGVPREVARRASEYHREMYCAVLDGVGRPVAFCGCVLWMTESAPVPTDGRRGGSNGHGLAAAGEARLSAWTRTSHAGWMGSKRVSSRSTRASTA